MRSRIGTASRLAAHILAIALLIILVAYAPPMPRPGFPETSTVAAVPSSPSLGTAAPDAAGAAPRVDEAAIPPSPLSREHTPETQLEQTYIVPSIGDDARMASETVTEEIRTEPLVESVRPPAEDGSEKAVDAPAPETMEPAGEPAESAVPPGVGRAPHEPEPQSEESPAAPQPDESESIILAPDTSAVDVEPLANANLQLLGEGVYWLDSRYDLEKELAATPEVGSLILLAPLPGYQPQGLGDVKYEVFPADAADLSTEAAEHFLHLVAESPRPVVAVALPGARGAAFFKGAYYLANRHISQEEMFRDIEPELEMAGNSREEIVHRLKRLHD